MKNFKNQRGSMTLETSIVLPLFLFLFLFIFGLFSIINAQNLISHSFVQSTKSLSLDSYLTENVESAGETSEAFWGSLSDLVTDIIRLDNDTSFTSSMDWYIDDNSMAEVIAKARFVGYLTGGDTDAADEKLTALGVIDGLDGLDFEVTVEGEVLTVTIKYQLQYWFDFADLGEIDMEQTLTTRLWK